MKAFNLEEAKAGKPVCTRNGKPVRIICFDKKNETYPIVALVERKDKGEDNFSYTLKGTYYDDMREDNDDLMMATEKKKGWINIYKSTDTYYNDIYNTKEEAISDRSELNYVTTTEIEWEE